MGRIKIHESEIKKENGSKAKMAIIRTSPNSENPISELDLAVHHYVEHEGYHEFIAIQLDNPWTRLILSDIDALNFEDFKEQEHRINKFK